MERHGQGIAASLTKSRRSDLDDPEDERDGGDFARRDVPLVNHHLLPISRNVWRPNEARADALGPGRLRLHRDRPKGSTQCASEDLEKAHSGAGRFIGTAAPSQFSIMAQNQIRRRFTSR